MKPQSYINFLWQSVNAHGVHSPFVFNFISKAFYAKVPRLTRSEHRRLDSDISYTTAELLYRIISGTRSAKLFVLGKETIPVTEMLRKLGEANNLQLWFFSPLAPIPGGADMAYISGKNEQEILPLLEQVIPNLGHDKFCIIGNIHSSPEMESAWNIIKNNPSVTVTIDTYHLGILFFRPEQAKQHFIIRATTSITLNSILGVKTLWGLLG